MSGRREGVDGWDEGRSDRMNEKARVDTEWIGGWVGVRREG